MRRCNRAFNNVRCRQIWSRRRDINKVPSYESYSNNNNNNDNDNDEDRMLLQANTDTPDQQESERQLEDENDDNNGYSYTSTVPAWILLTNSWACDVELYPKGCPDPYRLKARYDAVLQAVSQGLNPHFAFWSQRLKGPLRFFAFLFAGVGLVLYSAVYYLTRKDRFQHTGISTTIFEDIKTLCKKFFKFLEKACKACMGLLTGETRRKRRRKERHGNSTSRSPSGSKKISSSKKKKKKSKRADGVTSDGEATSDYFSVFT